MKRGNTFDKYTEKPESRKLFIHEVRETALSATIIPLSLFTNLFIKKFPKHEYLELTHELMQQVYIKMKTEPGCFCLFPGDLSIYSLKCIRCRRSITAPGSIGKTLYHAPIAMLHHWDMIVTRDATVDPPGEFDIASIPLVCTSLDSYYQALKWSLLRELILTTMTNFVFTLTKMFITRVLFVRQSRWACPKWMSHTLAPKGKKQNIKKRLLPILCPL
jgi:hypothetical protein